MTDNKNPSINLNGVEIKRLAEDALKSLEPFEVRDIVAQMQETINRQQADIEELTHKLECLLCHATGSKLSKSTYSLRTMELAVNDEVQKCCEESQSEAIKEVFAKLRANEIKPEFPWNDFYITDSQLEEIVKEMTEGE